MKQDLKQIGIFSLVIIGAILLVLYFYPKDHIDAQLFKTSDIGSTDITKSWESFKKELDIQSDSLKIEHFELILEKDQIYSVEFDLIVKSNGQLNLYRYMECILCEEEGERERDIFTITLENWSDYRDLMDADQFFSTLDSLQQEEMIQTMDDKYKMIAADGRNEEMGVEGDYYLLKTDGMHKVKKSSEGTYSGYSLHVMGNELPKEFGTSEDSITVFFDGQSK